MYSNYQTEKEMLKTLEKYPCCNSESEIQRLDILEFNRHIRKRQEVSEKSILKSSFYLLNYHQHKIQSLIVKYYNPRRGLENIDGNVYNLMPHANSSFKEIQYDFDFKSNKIQNKKRKKGKASIELVNIFSKNEMKQVINAFNDNKVYRHSRKIKFKEYLLVVIYYYYYYFNLNLMIAFVLKFL